MEVDDRWYVHNGMSGAVRSMSRSEREALDALVSGSAATGLSQDFLADLTLGRIVVAGGHDERDVLEARYRASRDDASILGLTIVTSLGCNFDCPYCFEAKHPSIIDLDVERSILAAVDRQIDSLSQLSVTWFGGEPLVGKRPLFSLSDAFIERCDANDVDYTASIITNGYLLDADMCRELAARRVRSAQIGLDGPPDVHDRYRPLASGGATFGRIVENLHHAADHFDVALRVNLDRSNAPRAVELLDILEQEGLRGRVSVYVANLVGSTVDGIGPNADYATPLMSKREFAQVELEFKRELVVRGFARPHLVSPKGTACTAVRRNSMVIGSAGELYKCWDSVGDPAEVTGHIDDHANTNSKIRRWLDYDPFADAECRECIALPVCMGGCAHHAFDEALRPDRCGTFRETNREQVLDLIAAMSGRPTLPRRITGETPVQLGATRRSASLELTR
ncbi:MAG: SPASM domain-containing protein [Acidimicrobiales bacterium]